MKMTALIAAGVAALAWHMPASAQDSTSERLANTERRVKYLEERVAAQDKVIVEKERKLATLDDGWFKALEIGGAVELEGVYENPYEEDSTTDAVVGTVELGVAARIHDWVGGEIVLLHEEDGDQDVTVDAATLTVAPPDGPWFLTGGRQYLPFGVFETNLISDPLTLDLGETSETALQLGISSRGFQGSVFAFNGDNNPDGSDRISGFGAALGQSLALGDTEVGLNLSWINDVGDADGLQDAIADSLGGNDIDDRVPAWVASFILSHGGLSLIGEYLTASRRFKVEDVEFAGDGAKPSGWMVEAGYGFDLAGKEATIAASYQRTREALALELPRKRALIGLSVAILEQVALAVEWAMDDDYGTAHGGTGRSADTVTIQLAAEF